MGKLHVKGVLENHLKDQSFPLVHGWVLPYFCERPVKNPSIWKESLAWIVPRIRSVRGENLERWHNGCRHWGVGDDGRIRNLLKKKDSNAMEVIFPKEKWKIHFSSRRWTNQTFWRRSGTENIHLDTGPLNLRRRSKRFSWRIRRVSTFTTSRLTSGCRWSDKWLLVHVRKLQKPPSRWTQSQAFSRREKNHSLFHWNTLTSPELHKRIWMLCKKAASMTVGISMDQEICLIPGQVSLSLLHWMRNLQTDICGPGGRLTKRQATSRPDHVKTTPQMTRFRDGKVCNNWLQMKLTITEYSLTTSAQLDYKIQEERTLYLVLRLRGETEHDTNDNVTIKGIASAWWNRARHQWQRDNQDPDRLPHKAHETPHLTWACV